MKRILSIVLILTAFWPLQAARVSLEAKLDSMNILIGNQVRMHLELTVPKGSRVEFPSFAEDTLTAGVLIVDRSPLDSQKVSNDRMSYRRSLLLTSFDQNLYYLPPVEVRVDDMVYESNYLSLNVLTYDVDTLSKEFFDIKPNQKMPLKWWEVALPVSIGLLGAALVVAIVYLVQRYRRRREDEGTVEPEMLLPPHVAALQALEAIKEEKIWQQGRYKEFHTGLTDVLRRYIWRRFGISALEMTTEEILSLLREEPEARELGNRLKEVLVLSDFVKFAKMNPLPEENDRSLRIAFEFVEETAPKETPEAGAEAETETSVQGKEVEA